LSQAHREWAQALRRPAAIRSAMSCDEYPEEEDLHSMLDEGDPEAAGICRAAKNFGILAASLRW